MTYYYSAESAHGTATSHGFSNDTIVFAFENKIARDKYVENSDNISCEAIRKKDVGKKVSNWSMTRNEYNKPRPFSGEYWGIVDYDYEIDLIPGCIGSVQICFGEEGIRVFN